MEWLSGSVQCWCCAVKTKGNQATTNDEVCEGERMERLLLWLLFIISWALVYPNLLIALTLLEC